MAGFAKVALVQDCRVIDQTFAFTATIFCACRALADGLALFWGKAEHLTDQFIHGGVYPGRV